MCCGSSHNGSPDATSKRIIPREPTVTISVPCRVMKTSRLLVSCGLSKRWSSALVSGSTTRIGPAREPMARSPSGVKATGAVADQQEGVVGGRGSGTMLAEQLARRAVTNLDLARLDLR